MIFLLLCMVRWFRFSFSFLALDLGSDVFKRNPWSEVLLQDFSLSTLYTHCPLVIAHVAFRGQNYTSTLTYQLQLYVLECVFKLSYNCLVILLVSTGLVVQILSGWAHSFLYILHMFLSWKAVEFFLCLLRWSYDFLFMLFM